MSSQFRKATLESYYCRLNLVKSTRFPDLDYNLLSLSKMMKARILVGTLVFAMSGAGCVAKFFEIRDNARFLAIEKPND